MFIKLNSTAEINSLDLEELDEDELEHKRTLLQSYEKTK